MVLVRRPGSTPRLTVALACGSRSMRRTRRLLTARQAVNLAACLAVNKRRVLLIDLDPQANATVSLGVDPGRLTRTIYQVLVADAMDAGTWPELPPVTVTPNV